MRVNEVFEETGTFWGVMTSPMSFNEVQRAFEQFMEHYHLGNDKILNDFNEFLSCVL